MFGRAGGDRRRGAGACPAAQEHAGRGTSPLTRDVLRRRHEQGPAKPTADAAPALSIPERILLFCVASGTDWEHAGITGTTVTAMIVRGLIQRDPAGRPWLTKEGRAVLAARPTAMAGFGDLNRACDPRRALADLSCHHRGS
jgi:hypothetical protein